MSSSRAVLLAALSAFLLVALAAWLLNVPVVVIAASAVVSLIALFLWLSRHAVAGKRSGAPVNKVESKQQDSP
jgi:hypothetical protein